MIVKISIRGLRFNIHHFNEYAVFTFYIKDVLFDNIHIFTQIIREIHIIDNFKINIFISKKKIIDFATQSIKINNYYNIIVFINSRARFEPIKRIIKSIFRIILSFRFTTSIVVIYTY